MLCHQRTQLHSAYTVLDGGCCLFFLSPFYGYRNRVCSCRFSRSMSGIGVGPSESERTESKEARVRRTVCALFFFFFFLKRQMPARVEKNLWLCASVRGRSKYECVPNGHHKDIYCVSRSLWSLLSLIVFYQL